MSGEDIEAVTKQLSEASVDSSSILSYAGKSFKLNTEEDAKQIIDDINNCTNVKTLNLEGNTLGVDAAVAIAKALEGHPEFERALWSDMFTGRLKSEIPEALRYLGSAIMLAGAKLVELDLSDNAFGPNGMKGLTELLKSSSCYTLRELKLHNNGLGTTGGKMLAKCLLECHESSCKAGTPLALRVFVSGRGRLENEGSLALAEAFKAMGSLEEVQMPQNGINHEGISALAAAFAHNPNLRHVNLNDNTFTKRGARAMARALPRLKKLEVMNFGDCLVRTEGAEALALGIKDLKHLKTINLSFNEINRVAANAIAEVMENKAHLQKLDLDGNNLGDEGIELVTATMEAIGKAEFLGDIEEDDGTDEEAGNQSDTDDDDPGQHFEVPEDDQEGEEVNDPQLTVRGTGVTPRPTPQAVSAADFLQFPSPTKLEQMSSSKCIIEHLGESCKEVEEAVSTFMKVSSVVGKADDKKKLVACQCADDLFKILFSSSDHKANLFSTFTNCLLVHLGLIKSEDKKFRPPSNLTGPLVVLEYVVRQKYFPSASRSTLQFFLGKAHPVLDTYKDLKHNLLQTLYQF